MARAVRALSSTGAWSRISASTGASMGWFTGTRLFPSQVLLSSPLLGGREHVAAAHTDEAVLPVRPALDYVVNAHVDGLALRPRELAVPEDVAVLRLAA